MVWHPQHMCDGAAGVGGSCEAALLVANASSSRPSALPGLELPEENLRKKLTTFVLPSYFRCYICAMLCLFINYLKCSGCVRKIVPLSCEIVGVCGLGSVSSSSW